MPIRILEVHDYQLPIGGKTAHSRNVTKIKDIISRRLTSLNIGQLDVYNLDGVPHNHRAGRKDSRVVVYLNGVQQGSPADYTLEVPFMAGGITYDAYKTFHSPMGDGKLIKSDNGVALAEWREETYELNILFDVFNGNPTYAINIFDFIMTKFEEIVWYAKMLENSWKHSQNKTGLTSRFLGTLRKQKKRALKNDKDQVTLWERSINDYKLKIKQISDSLAMKMRSIAVEEANIENVGDALLKDLDAIINHEKIKDLHIVDNKFIIYTNPLYIYSDKNKKYYGGNYRIELDPENTDVRFFGDNPRQGYWTNSDPHPHVSGSDGHACLGNVSSTIAELCSQMQMYALTLVAIDFLESANTGDAAGRNVVRWDECDEDGVLLKDKATTTAVREPDEGEFRCSYCGEIHNDDESEWVYNRIDEDGNETDGTYVCTTCRDNYYHYDENCEIYLNDNID